MIYFHFLSSVFFFTEITCRPASRRGFNVRKQKQKQIITNTVTCEDNFVDTKALSSLFSLSPLLVSHCSLLELSFSYIYSHSFVSVHFIFLFVSYISLFFFYYSLFVTPFDLKYKKKKIYI